MKQLIILLGFFGLVFTASGQNAKEQALNSISSEELKNHLFFLASDYLNGRVATEPEYEIAAQYVATQFAAAGLEPAITANNGSKTFFQGVPFRKTTYNEHLEWVLQVGERQQTGRHNHDFKILFGSNLDLDNLPLVWAGYGISEPDHGWDDLAGLDIAGKVVICMDGTPQKNGRAVLPAEVNAQYTGSRALRNKVFRGLYRNRPAAVIMVDVNGTGEVDLEGMQSRFRTISTSYAGSESRNSSGANFPTVFVAGQDQIRFLLQNERFNPLDEQYKERRYQTAELNNSFFTCKADLISEDVVYSNNVVGMVPGTDPVLKDEYVIVGAHLDHVRPSNGEVCNGADDNASGSSGVIEIAEATALNPGKRTVIFTTWTAEEMGLLGSRFFVESGVFPKDQLKFNINLDMIGRSSPENSETRAHYVVSHQKYLDKLKTWIDGLNAGITDFPLLFENDQDSPGGSDHQSFIGADIPAFFFFSGVHPDLHRPGDDPEKIDYRKAESICRLSYLLVDDLANSAIMPDFLQNP